MKIKSYLHHILPPFSILVVVVSVVQVGVGLLQVNAAGAASLPDLTVCAAHVDEPKDGEGNRNRDQGANILKWPCRGVIWKIGYGFFGTFVLF